MNHLKMLNSALILGLFFLAGCGKSLDEERIDCLTDASNAPTDTGVRQRVALCNQKYPTVSNTAINTQSSISPGGAPSVDWSKFKPDGLIVNDPQYGLSVTKPSNWLSQPSPSAQIRFMFGFHGDGYVGNCNVNLLHSPSTVGKSQEEVDRTENLKKIPAAFFEAALQRAGYNALVTGVTQVRRGMNTGHLVNYSYQSFSPSLNTNVHYRAELFSHSRPGGVYSITCMVGATTSEAAQKYFFLLQPEFEILSSSLKVNGK